jgi:hypothetical protein
MTHAGTALAVRGVDSTALPRYASWFATTAVLLGRPPRGHPRKPLYDKS